MAIYCDEKYDGLSELLEGAVVCEKVDFVRGTFKILGSDMCVNESAYQKYEARLQRPIETFTLSHVRDEMSTDKDDSVESLIRKVIKE